MSLLLDAVRRAGSNANDRGAVIRQLFATKNFRSPIGTFSIEKTGDSSLDRVTKTTVFLANLADFQAMNEVYAERFGTHKPARSTVGAPLLRGAKVEIDCIAVRRNA